MTIPTVDQTPAGIDSRRAPADRPIDHLHGALLAGVSSDRGGMFRAMIVRTSRMSGR